MKTINFVNDDGTRFYKALHRRVHSLLGHKPGNYRANTFMIFKVALYFLLFITSFITIFLVESPAAFFIMYTLMGMIVLGIVFNVSHDAAHNTISKHPWVNKLLYYSSFTLLGNNPYVWKKYHIESHHMYTNVEGSDIDVVRNSFIRLHADEPVKPYHRFQHIYAPVLYMFYTLNFVILRDACALLGRTDRTISVTIPLRERILYGCYKIIYFGYTLVLPMAFSRMDNVVVLAAFFIMHFTCSLLIITVLGCNHQVDEISHYSSDDAEAMEKSWVSLQLETSLDYNPGSKSLNFLLGGFNAHTVHHLFPHICHVHYPRIVPLMKQTAEEFGMVYHVAPYHKAMSSHFRFLKKMGANETQVYYEAQVQ